MGIEKTMVPVLAVALITWGGVFLYLWRLDRMSRKLEESVRDLPRADLAPAGLAPVEVKKAVGSFTSE